MVGWDRGTSEIYCPTLFTMCRSGLAPISGRKLKSKRRKAVIVARHSGHKVRADAFFCFECGCWQAG